MEHVYNWLTALAFGFLGYFEPMRGVVHVMVAAIVIDMITGIWAAVRRGEGLKSCKLWQTGRKLLLSIVVVVLFYAMDQEMSVDVFQLHKVAAWLITGFEMWSILENAAQISDHPVFRIIKKMMSDRLKKRLEV